MIKVGITGGIGSGKTTVSSIFQELGVPVYNSDLRAKWLMANHEPLKLELLKQFGSETYTDGHLNRAYLSKLVFGNSKKLTQLNNSVHPVVRNDFINWLEDKKGSKMIIKEAAILIESGAYKELDQIILVVCSEENRIKRVMLRDKVKSESVKQRIQFQMNDQEKLRLADHIINNEKDDLMILKEQIKSLYNKIIDLSKPEDL